MYNSRGINEIYIWNSINEFDVIFENRQLIT